MQLSEVMRTISVYYQGLISKIGEKHQGGEKKAPKVWYCLYKERDMCAYKLL